MADYAGGHDEGGRLFKGRLKLGVEGVDHAVGVLEATGTGDGIGTARVDDDAANTFTIAAEESFAADGNGSSLELVLGEDSGSRARLVRSKYR